LPPGQGTAKREGEVGKSEVLAKYGLPAVPEEGTGDRNLHVFRSGEEKLLIAENVTLESAQEYCSREDTHGNGWFVAFNRA
jgi:hypothetical protein